MAKRIDTDELSLLSFEDLVSMIDQLKKEISRRKKVMKQTNTKTYGKR